MTDDGLIRELEALKVGPNDVLILRVRVPNIDDGSGAYDHVADVERALRHVGIADRCLVVTGDDIEVEAVVPRSETAARPA